MPRVCVVIPCYNEERRLRGDDVLALARAHAGVTICFVDDGSTDGTRGMIDSLRAQCPARMMVLGLARNSGKAEAVRQGVVHAAAAGAFDYIGYWDADLSAPLSELSRLLDRMTATPRLAIVMGSRVKRLGASIVRNPLRHVLGRVFATGASWLLRLPVYDSQCGAKLFRPEVVTLAFHDRFLTRWLFDLEILARLRNAFGEERILQAVAEVPLEAWHEVGGSKLRSHDFVRVPIELLRIHVHYNGGLLSRRPRAAS